MSRTTITLEIDPEHEDLLRQYAGFLEQMNDLGATAPDGSAPDACEDAVIERDRGPLLKGALGRAPPADRRGVDGRGHPA